MREIEKNSGGVKAVALHWTWEKINFRAFRSRNEKQLKVSLE